MVMIKKDGKYVTVHGRHNKTGKGGDVSRFYGTSKVLKDEKGNPKAKAGPGRPKGLQNKISGEAKKMIALAFEGIGGLQRLIDWADENPAAFYTQVYTKIIALQVQGKIDLDVHNDGEEARRKLEDAFVRLIEARRTGSEDPAVYINNERMRDVTPQLVIPRKTGTDTP